MSSQRKRIRTDDSDEEYEQQETPTQRVKTLNTPANEWEEEVNKIKRKYSQVPMTLTAFIRTNNVKLKTWFDISYLANIRERSFVVTILLKVRFTHVHIKRKLMIYCMYKPSMIEECLI